MIKYTTKDLYGPGGMSEFKDEIPFFLRRIARMEEVKTKENRKHWSFRDDHLIKKINDSQEYYHNRIKEINPHA